MAEAACRPTLVRWVRQNLPTLSAFELLTTAETAATLQTPDFLATLRLNEVAALEAGGDILLAARVLSGDVVAVVCFADQRVLLNGRSDLDGLIRACLLRQIPLALNEATASLAMRGLARSRVGYLIFNPVAGQGNPQQELALIRSLLEPQILLTLVITKPDLDPGEQARELVAAIQAHPDGEAGSRMIIASGGDGTVSAVAGALIGSGIPLGIIPGVPPTPFRWLWVSPPRPGLPVPTCSWATPGWWMPPAAMKRP